jgi:acid phosphatase class B
LLLFIGQVLQLELLKSVEAFKTLLIKLKTIDLRQQWLQILNEYGWNYFITCRTPNKIYKRTVSTWIDKLSCNSTKVEKIFYVLDRDKEDYNNYNMLIDNNSSITYP